MRAFITGLSGFAGSFLGEHLLASGDQVLGCSATGQWRPESPAILQENVPLLTWQLPAPPPAELEERLHAFQPECIFHLAALSVPRDCGHGSPTLAAQRTNVAGTQRVIELALRMSSQPRLLLASSSYVYGAVTQPCAVVDEQSPVAPQTGYGQTKLEAEQAVLEAVATRGFDGVIARAFQHTGPRQSPRMMLPEWARQFALPADQPIQVISLDSYIDLSDVRDVVRAYRLLAERGEAGGIYNVGSGLCLRSGDVFEQLRQLAGPSRSVVELQPGLRCRPIADIRRLAHVTGWQPEISLERTLVDTWQYWKTRGFPEASPA